MFDEEKEKQVNLQNNERRNQLILMKNTREYDNLKAQFKADISNGKNVGTVFNRMISTLDGIPEEMPTEIIKRALDMAGLAAVSKAPYLNSAISRALTRAVQICQRNGRFSESCKKQIQRALESCENKIKTCKDGNVLSGLNALKAALKNINSRPVSTTKVNLSIQQNSADLTDSIEYDEIDEEKLAKSIDKILEHAASSGIFMDSVNDIILQENLRTATRRVANSITQTGKNIGNKSRVVSNTISDTVQKHDIRIARREVMEGKRPFGTFLKVLTASIAVSAELVTGEFAVATLAIHLIRRSRNRKKERIKILNELITEMEIINEKIKDAEADNDRQKKYNYIRLRREIQRALDQIRYGSRVSITRMPMKL